jgi:hypothetical protein
LDLQASISMGRDYSMLKQLPLQPTGMLFRAAANMIGARCTAMNPSGMTTRPTFRAASPCRTAGRLEPAACNPGGQPAGPGK